MILRFILLLLIISPIWLSAQTTIGGTHKPTEGALLDLKNALDESESDENLIPVYINLANALIEKGEYQKAETNIQKVIKLVEKSKDKTRIPALLEMLEHTQSLKKAEIQAVDSITTPTIKEPSLEVKQEPLPTTETSNRMNVKIESIQHDSIKDVVKVIDPAIQKSHLLEEAIQGKDIKLIAQYSQELLDIYKKTKQQGKIVESYSNLIAQLETLATASDPQIDTKIIEVHEQVIAQLENERSLKDELIEEKNLFNYVLIGFIVVTLLFAIFMTKTVFAIKKKNKKIALQSLRREMNPHFIFNSLNSVNQFIAQNNELEANKYLSSYSKLMRTMMESSNKDFVRLSTELSHLTKYLDLELMRFGDKFSYSFHIDESIDTESIFVPNMIIQPLLENSIWHGLRYLDKGGLLSVSVKSDRNKLYFLIEDNGIGIRKSQELKTSNQKSNKSRGLSNTHERIRLLNSIYKVNITLAIEDKIGELTGVTISLETPLIYKIEQDA